MNCRKLIFEKQGLHYSLLAMLVAGTLVVGRTDRFSTGQFTSIPAFEWLCFGIGYAVLHQVYVWFCWRTQLYRLLLTRLFGQRAFFYYEIGFVILTALRYFAIVGLAAANVNSLPVNRWLLVSIAAIMIIPLVYLFYSVIRYFGIKRALGADHFDDSYRRMPLVRQGIFRYNRNSMYTFGFLLAWIPGLITASSAALLLALFNNLYIWVHYYATEKPDMMTIYGGIGTPGFSNELTR